MQLKQVDGYLTLTASGWLQPGANRVGSAADNRFRFPARPRTWARCSWRADGQVSLHLSIPAASRIDGQPARTVNVLRTQGA